MPDLTLRLATADDVDALERLVHAAYRAPGDAGWTTEAAILDGQRADATMLTGLVADSDVEIVVATIGSQLVGCGALHHPPGDPVAEFGLFAVEPVRQGCGIGGSVLAHVETLAAAEGARRIRLQVIHLRHELLAWYQRRGYEPTGETEPFPYDDERFGVPRRDDLHFIILERLLPQA